VGWLAPILATAVAVVVLTQRDLIRRDPRIRRTVNGLFLVAGSAALVSAGLGTGINKIAPNAFLFQ
jgi:hypothetical protein